jgi:hypothetical protein
MGFDWTAAQKALGRAVTLNPRLMPAWHHLFVNSVGKDTVESTRALAGFEALPTPRLTSSHYQVGDLPHLRLLDAVDRAGGVVEPKDSALADSLARRVLSPGLTQEERDRWSLTFLWAWNPRGQVEFNRRVLRLTADPAVEAQQLRGIAWAWAERGAWDSALAAFARAGMRQPDPFHLGHYSIAVLGAWLGVVSPDRAGHLRRQASLLIDGLEPGSKKADLLGWLAWLDGVLAFARGDRIAVEHARSDAKGSGHPQSAVIDRSLAAFGRALRGERAAAGRELAALERECPGGCGDPVTPNIAAHRLAAATWLLEAGDTAQAARLLIWHEARFDVWQWSFVTRPLAYLMLARIEEARGHVAAARAHYAQFLRHYDSPMPAQQHLVAEGRAAMSRLAGDPLREP